MTININNNKQEIIFRKDVEDIGKLDLIESQNFGEVTCNFYKNEKEDILMTREQIGQALEYKNPRESIKDIHSRHKERLEKFSRRAQIDTSSGKQEMILYTAKGVYEVCRWSHQPKANDFMDWVWEVIEKIRKKEVIFVNQNLINSFKKEIKEYTKEQIAASVEKIQAEGEINHRPSHATKLDISRYIKQRLGIDNANEEYEIVKQRIFIILNVSKWEDIPFEVLRNSMNIIDESINVVKKDRAWGQLDLFGSLQRASM